MSLCVTLRHSDECRVNRLSSFLSSQEVHIGSEQSRDSETCLLSGHELWRTVQFIDCGGEGQAAVQDGRPEGHRHSLRGEAEPDWGGRGGLLISGLRSCFLPLPDPGREEFCSGSCS